MMMQRTDPNIPTCRSCLWFCYERNNVGRCGNREKMAVDGIQNLPHRFATDTCDGWRPKHRVMMLTDDDLADADRQAKKIKEEQT